MRYIYLYWLFFYPGNKFCCVIVKFMSQNNFCAVRAHKYVCGIVSQFICKYVDCLVSVRRKRWVCWALIVLLTYPFVYIICSSGGSHALWYLNLVISCTLVLLLGTFTPPHLVLLHMTLRFQYSMYLPLLKCVCDFSVGLEDLTIENLRHYACFVSSIRVCLINTKSRIILIIRQSITCPFLFNLE